MINETFEARCIKFAPKSTSDGDVITEFILQYTSDEPGQSILDGLSKNFSNDINKCMDYTEWKTIAFDVESVHLQMTFNEVNEWKMPCELKQIRIAKKEKDGETIFTYKFVFTKDLNNKIDAAFAQAYLNRKERDDDDKLKPVNYKILLTE
jgi:hypothetical protein